VHKVLGADAGPHRLDALNEVGVAEDILRFEKVQDLEQQFVYGGILGSELKRSLGEFERLVQVLRTFPLGLGVCQVRRCSQGPGRLDQCRRLSKEGRGKPGERVRFRRPTEIRFAMDSLLERDGFELVVPDFRETFLLYRFRAANWPGPTAGLMTNLATPLGSPLMAAF
jgi:hypothetical protein